MALLEKKGFLNLKQLIYAFNRPEHRISPLQKGRSWLESKLDNHDLSVRRLACTPHDRSATLSSFSPPGLARTL